MRKKFVRLLMSIVCLGFGILLFANFSAIGHKLLQIQEECVLVRYTLGTVGVLCPLCTFTLWGLMLYHWGTHVFKSKAYKRFWFLAMSLGMFVGAWFYYIAVFELGKTVIGSNGVKSQEE